MLGWRLCLVSATLNLIQQCCYDSIPVCKPLTPCCIIDQSVTQCDIDYIDHFSHGRSRNLSFLKYTVILSMGLLPRHTFLPKLSLLSLYFTQHPYWPQNMLPGQRNALLGSYCTVRTMFPTVQKQLSWYKVGRVLGKMQLQWQLGSNTCRLYLLLMKDYSKGCTWSQSASKNDTFSRIARMHRSRNQGTTMRMVSLIITPCHQLAKFLCPVSINFRSSRPDVLLLEGDCFCQEEQQWFHWPWT